MVVAHQVTIATGNSQSINCAILCDITDISSKSEAGVQVFSAFPNG